MGIQVKCECGAQYNMKEKHAGQAVKCPKCKARIEVPGQVVQQEGDSVFHHDKFLLRQKHFAISAKYYVWDEEGNTILFIRRPAHLIRNFFAVFAGVLAGIAVGTMMGALLSLITNETVSTAIGVLMIVVTPLTIFFVIVLLYKKRHITFYRDDSEQEKLLEIFQDKKVEFITATYTMNDPDGKCIARFRKNFLYNIIRKRWYCFAPEGSLLCVAKEESIILSLLRRLLGTFFGLLRVNFIILQGNSDNIIGEFNRKFTLLDRYVLDMTRDSGNEIDRRIAIALGVLLDTGERR